MSNTAFAPGKHLLLDFYGCRHLSDTAKIKAALIEAAHACGATVLDIKLHAFNSQISADDSPTGRSSVNPAGNTVRDIENQTNMQNCGATGVALLAESHISIHTWPESAYAAIDIFMCGDCKPELAIAPLRAFFAPREISQSIHQRGQNLEHASASALRADV